MLTVEQVKDHSELSIKVNLDAFPRLEEYKLRILYLKDNLLCCLGYVGWFPFLDLSEKQISEYGEGEIKGFILLEDWLSFTKFINESLALTSDMLISFNEAHERQEQGIRLGIYKIFEHGQVDNRY